MEHDCYHFNGKNENCYYEAPRLCEDPSPECPWFEERVTERRSDERDSNSKDHPSLVGLCVPADSHPETRRKEGPAEDGVLLVPIQGA